MQQEFEIADRMYKCHSAAKDLYQREYPSKISRYRKAVMDHSDTHKVPVLRAALAICSMPYVKDNATATMLFMAAAAEIIESCN